MGHLTEQAAGEGSAPSSVYRAIIDNRQVGFAQPEPTSREMLSEAGLHPADDFALIILEPHGTRALGLDQRVDLRQPAEKKFRAFKTDRIYRFTIDERGYEWGVAIVSEPKLREIGHVPGDEELVRKLADGMEIPLAPGDKLDLGGPVTEHLRTKKKLITVFYDGGPKRIDARVYTTEQLEKKFEVPAGYLLNYVNEHGQLVTMKPEQHLHVREGMKFFSQAPGGGSA